MDLIPDDLFMVEKEVSIDLYTLKNKNEPQILIPNDIKSIKESNFNKNIPTRICVHGFHSKKGALRNAFVKGKSGFILSGLSFFLKMNFHKNVD